MEKFNNLPINAEKNIIKAMIKVAVGNNASNIKNLISSIGIDEDQKAMFWRAVLSQLSSQRKEIDSQTIQHPLPVREIDYNNGAIESLIAFIQSFCDAQDLQPGENDKILESRLYEELKAEVENDVSQTDDEYWNQQIKSIISKIVELLEIYKEDIDNNNIPVIKSNGQIILNIGNLRYANAAKDFEGEPWVEPERNIDLKTYSEIRNKDKILEILNNPNKLDNTFESEETDNESERKSFISLIMPRYGRRVEVEDLDRNFWVIADIIDGMSSWVLEESPINEILNKLINETVKLWENILYLWLQIALISQKKSDDNLTLTDSVKMIQTEDLLKYENIPTAVCKLKEDNTYDIKIAKFKFMGKEIDLNQEEKTNPLTEYEETYAEQDLCYISKIKLNNYRSNYYSGEWYNKIIFSSLNGVDDDENLEKRRIKSYEIYERYTDSDGDKERPMIISVDPSCEVSDGIGDNKNKRFTPYILSASYHNGKFFLGYPFTSTGEYLVEQTRETLYCGLRVVPNIEIERDTTGDKIIKKFELKVYDAIYNVITNSKNSEGLNNYRLIGTFSASAEKGTIDDGKIYMVYTPTEDIQIPEQIAKTENKDYFAKYSLTEIEWKGVDFSYYLGECLSWRERTSRITKTENLIQEPIFLKIGNFLPEGQWNNEIRTAPPIPSIGMMTLSGGYASNMRGDFTFYGVPIYYDRPAEIQNIEPEDNYINPPEDNLKPTEPQNNSYGQSDGTPGLLYFYNFSWENYLPEYDIPGKILDNKPYGINSSTYNLCFKINPSQPYGKRCGDEITTNFLLELGKSAVANYLIKVSKASGHPHQYYYKKPCTFITCIGLAPSLKNDNFIQYDVNAICHIIKYLPSPTILDEKDGQQQNYTRIYNSYSSQEIIYDDKIYGKIIEDILIDRYDSYYDRGAFTYMITSEPGNIYTGTENSRQRGLIITNENDDSNYCKLITINDLRKEYKINFQNSFLGMASYYDFYKASTESNLPSLLLNELNDIYQISDGLFEVGISSSNEIVEYHQPTDYNGGIRMVNNKSYLARKNDVNLVPHESSNYNTGLLTIQSNVINKKSTPLLNGSIIDKIDYTPQTFGAWAQDSLLNARYAVSSINTKVEIPIPNGPTIEPNPNISTIEQPINMNELPDWFFMTEFKADYNSQGDRITTVYDQGINQSGIDYFPYFKVVKNGSELKAYQDLYTSIKNKTNIYITQTTEIYDSINYDLLQIQQSVPDNWQNVYNWIIKLKNKTTGDIITLNEQVTGQYYYNAEGKTYYISPITEKTVSYLTSSYVINFSDNQKASVYMKNITGVDSSEIDWDSIPKYCLIYDTNMIISLHSPTDGIDIYSSYIYDKNSEYCTKNAIKALWINGTKALDLNNNWKVLFSDTLLEKSILNVNPPHVWYAPIPGDTSEDGAGSATLIPKDQIYYDEVSAHVLFGIIEAPDCYYIKTTLSKTNWEDQGFSINGEVYYCFSKKNAGYYVNYAYNTLWEALRKEEDINNYIKVDTTVNVQGLTYNVEFCNPPYYIEGSINKPEGKIINVEILNREYNNDGTPGKWIISDIPKEKIYF